VNVPDHVPPELVVDFDLYELPGVAGDTQRAWKDALPDRPLVYTPEMADIG
jgi:hypothetical protein